MASWQNSSWTAGGNRVALLPEHCFPNEDTGPSSSAFRPEVDTTVIAHPADPGVLGPRLDIAHVQLLVGARPRLDTLPPVPVLTNDLAILERSSKMHLLLCLLGALLWGLSGPKCSMRLRVPAGLPLNVDFTDDHAKGPIAATKPFAPKALSSSSLSMISRKRLAATDMVYFLRPMEVRHANIQGAKDILAGV